MLIGASGAGKTTFARRHFRASEILSSDHYREVVGDDDRDARTTADAFEMVHAVARKRLRTRRTTVIDATNIRGEDRVRYVDLARGEHGPLTAVVIDPGERACYEQNAAREASRRLPQEGFRHVLRLDDSETIATAMVTRTRLACDIRDDGGPFDIVGDVHGCAEELETLFDRLGYQGGRGRTTERTTR